MKIRHGFVSNSSSTSFTFCYKGKGIEPLCKLILNKYKNQFNLSYNDWHCNALDVVEAIERCAKGINEWTKVKTVSIDHVIKDTKAYLKQAEEDLNIEKEKGVVNSWATKYILEDKQELETKLRKLDLIKKRGLTTALVMGFGDNDGHVSGTDVGCAMDYDGRNINIDEKDLAILTEQDR